MAEFIAGSIVRSRVESESKSERARLLQAAQLEGGHVIYEGDGEVEERVECPACTPDRAENVYEQIRAEMELAAGPDAAAAVDRLWQVAGTVAVPVPYGLRATRRAKAGGPTLHIEKLADDVLVWAVRNGVLKVSLDNNVLKALDKSTTREVLEMLPRLGLAIDPPSEDGDIDVLSRMTEKQIREALV